jgi:hypothetical protein
MAPKYKVIMKKILFVFLFISGICFAQNGVSFDFDEVITASNDTLTFDLGNLEDVYQLEYFAESDDSLNLLMTIYYKGAGTKELSVLDSLKTTNDAGAAITKVLRGYGASGIVNVIPGATHARIYAIRRTDSAVTAAFKLTVKKIIY